MKNKKYTYISSPVTTISTPLMSKDINIPFNISNYGF